MTMNPATTYIFKDGTIKPSIRQHGLYGKKFVEQKLGKESTKITQQEVSDLIADYKKKLNKIADEFTLKAPTHIATFSQFSLLGQLIAEEQGITTMTAISEAISKFN